MEYKMVIVGRKDLKISEGKFAVQAAHAAVMCALESKMRSTSWFKKWVHEGQKKVVLKVESEEELRELEAFAKSKNLVACVVEDAGLTELPPGIITCLGIGPAPNPIMDEITGKLALW